MRAYVAIAMLIAAVSSAAADDPMREARDHYARGNRLYNVADFDGAIAEFKQAYELSRAPKLLFNLAQAYRLKRSNDQALFLYTTYLRLEPDAPNRADVEQRIAELRQPQTPTPPSSESQAPPIKLTARPELLDPTPRQHALRVVGPITLAGGIVSIAVGGYCLGLSVADSQQLDRMTASGGTWDTNARALYGQGQSSRNAGLVLLPIGAAVAVTGAVLTYFGYRHVRTALLDFAAAPGALVR